MWRHIFPLCWNRPRQPVSYPVFLLSMVFLVVYCHWSGFSVDCVHQFLFSFLCLACVQQHLLILALQISRFANTPLTQTEAKSLLVYRVIYPHSIFQMQPNIYVVELSFERKLTELFKLSGFQTSPACKLARRKTVTCHWKFAPLFLARSGTYRNNRQQIWSEVQRDLHLNDDRTLNIG